MAQRPQRSLSGLTFWGQAKRPIDKKSGQVPNRQKLGKQAKRPIDKKIRPSAQSTKTWETGQVPNRQKTEVSMSSHPLEGARGRASQTLAQEECLIFEQSKAGARGMDLPPSGVEGFDPSSVLPETLRRQQPAELPEVCEAQVMRHFVRLSQWNYSIDTGMYPLGSCTMKYNPRANESAAAMPEFGRLHPYMPVDWCQGALALMSALEDMLCAISGLDACSLQPAAGAHGELTGLWVMRAALAARGQGTRNKILVPDSAHGTNPASSSLAGCTSVELKSGDDGLLDPEAVRAAMDEDCVGLMVTNPNTLGFFESRIAEVAQIVHERGGLVYLDGANMNAIQGKVRPADMGVDVMHFNLHKTYSTPHGGGGPGSGPICVTQELAPFLPVPRILRDENGRYSLSDAHPQAIGKVKAFYGNFLILVRAYAYIRALGAEGVRQNAELAVLNANYLRAHLLPTYKLARSGHCMHEVVLCDASFKEQVKTLDLCKRLMDYGFHPPTMYFPLNVSGAIMIEPTESESKLTLDRFVKAMLEIHAEA
ncbi:MAG: aminomethyl-transferring glycine dehydrogenase subunit GcvPB, partial [Myxococcota bacterium]|nr:aminomethyl-transferring glycine dehydrogenase subunit GcvPB [Myxococcota bacterium]